MTNSIGPLNHHALSVPEPVPNPFGDSATEPGQVNFRDLLLGMVEQTVGVETSAQAAIEESIVGGDITQSEVFSAVKKADLALRMMLQIRNKLLEAYDEIKQMQM